MIAKITVFDKNIRLVPKETSMYINKELVTVRFTLDKALIEGTNFLQMEADLQKQKTNSDLINKSFLNFNCADCRT